jgi:hypothetical protein
MKGIQSPTKSFKLHLEADCSYHQIDQLDNLSNKMKDKELSNAHTELDKEKTNICTKIDILNQQKLQAESKLQFAIQNLVCFVTDNIFDSFTADTATKEKIALSCLKPRDNSQYDFKAILTSIVYTCLNIESNSSKIASDIKSVVEEAIDNSVAELSKTLNTTEYLHP